MAGKRRQGNAATSNRELKRARRSVPEVDPEAETETELDAQPLPHRVWYNIVFLRALIKKLDTHVQIKLRPVCYLWKQEFESVLGHTPTLKLNLIQTIPGGMDEENRWAPEQSMQSFQFDRNWTEPKLDEDQKPARLTVQGAHFTKAYVDRLVSLFFNVKTLVVYFDCNEDQRVFANLLRLIKNLRMPLASFSLIREAKLNDINFIPNLCRTLDTVHSPLTRLDLYVDNGGGADRTPTQAMALPKSIQSLQHLALPYMMNQTDQRAILRNIGAKLERYRQKGYDGSLTSMCIPMLTNDVATNATNRLDMAQVFGANPEMQHIRRLQLNRVGDRFATVRETRQLCPDLEALHLFDCDQIDTSAFIAMINEYEHLTDVALFGECLTPFIEGRNAPRVRTLAIGGNYWFEDFKVLVKQQEAAERQRQRQLPPELRAPVPRLQIRGQNRGVAPPRVRASAGTWPLKLADAFVKLITLKFPQLEKLTLLAFEDAFDEVVCRKIESSIANKLKAKAKKARKLNRESNILKVINIKIMHVLFRE